MPLNYLPCHPLPDLRDVFLQIDTNSEYMHEEKVNIECLQDLLGECGFLFKCIAHCILRINKRSCGVSDTLSKHRDSSLPCIRILHSHRCFLVRNICWCCNFPRRGIPEATTNEGCHFIQDFSVRRPLLGVTVDNLLFSTFKHLQTQCVWVHGMV